VTHGPRVPEAPESGIEAVAPVELDDWNDATEPRGAESRGAEPSDTLPPEAPATIPAPPPSGPRVTPWANKQARLLGLDDFDDKP
jgi:hypothetical protein